MIKINLLPAQYRKRNIQLPDLSAFKIIPIAVGAIAFLAGLYLILSVITGVKSSSLKRIKVEWQSIADQKETADKLKKEMKRLKKKAKIIDELVIDRLLWSKKLNQLSDLMLDGIWLQNLSLGEKKDKKTLVLKGYVISRKKEETALIGNFMQRLRGDQDFFSDFEDIELESIKRTQMGEAEVMEFKLVIFIVQKENEEPREKKK